jgi:hypothetical protein
MTTIAITHALPGLNRGWRAVVVMLAQLALAGECTGLAAAEQSEQAATPAVSSTPATAVPSPRTPGDTVRIGRSALLVIDAKPAGDVLLLQITRVTGTATVPADDVAAAVDGKAVPVTRSAAGISIPLDELHGEAHAIDITVAHDGIREIISGRLTIPDRASAGSLWRDHKQVAWWILNILIVLIAAIAISRRKG